MAFAGLRVTLVGPLPPPAGGMANLTHQLAERLRGEGALVHLVQTNTPYRPARVGGIPLLRAAFRLAPYLLSLWRAAGKSDVFHVMSNSGWSWHLFSVPAIWLASWRGVPVLINYHGGEAAAFLSRSASLVERSMRRVSALAVPSRFLHEVFGRFGMSAEILPNLVDFERFRPRPPRQSPSAHLVVSRNLEPIYDNETALRSFQLIRQRHPHATLTIAGSGPEAPRLRDLAASLGVADAVCFAGRLDRDEMAALYQRADVMLNPSRVDNMPISILESWASGVPIVSTNVGGIPFMVRDGTTALLVPPGDASAMAAAALRVLEDARLWGVLAAAGQAEVQRYTWARIAPVLAELYGRMRGEKQPATNAS